MYDIGDTSGIMFNSSYGSKTRNVYFYVTSSFTYYKYALLCKYCTIIKKSIKYTDWHWEY